MEKGSVNVEEVKSKGDGEDKRREMLNDMVRK
jgi:hypothetical protein